MKKLGIIAGLHKPAEPPFAGGIEASSWCLGELLAEHCGPQTEIYYFSRGKATPKNTKGIHFGVLPEPEVYQYENEAAGSVLRIAEEFKLDALINLAHIPSLVAANAMGYGPPMLHWLQLNPFGWYKFTNELCDYAESIPSRSKLLFQTASQRAEYAKILDVAEAPIIPMPVGHEAFQQGVAPMTPEYSKLVWAGRAVAEKGISEAFSLAKAAYSYQHLKTVFFVPQKTELLERLMLANKAFIEQGAVEVNIGAEYMTIMSFLRKNAYALLMPIQSKTEEGLPYTEAGSRLVIEALLQGCPVIGTENGCLIDWITDSKNGFLLEEGAGLLEWLSRVNKSVELSRLNIQLSARADFSRHMIAQSLLHVLGTL